MPEVLYPAANVAHCVSGLTWEQLSKLGPSTFEKAFSTGGLSELMVVDEFEVWMCTTLSSCGGSGGVVCFTFSEAHEVFVPWDYACKLEIHKSSCIDIVQMALLGSNGSWQSSKPSVVDDLVEISPHAIAVLSWNEPTNLDLDLWVNATYSSGSKEFVGWNSRESYNSTLGASSISLLLDSLSGLEGPEITTFRDLADGTYEVWVNINEDTFTEDMLTRHPASVGIYCLKCLGSDGLPKSGHVDSVQQDPSDLPSDDVAWWKVGTWVKLAPQSSFAGYDLQWQACTSGCYTDEFAPELLG